MAPPTVASRRDRPADPGAAMVADALAAKLLHGWLQNRHQTLVPLTLNLRVLSPEQRRVVAGGLAALLLAGRARAEALGRAPKLREWLRELGADAETQAAFDGALDATPSLDTVIESAQALDLTVYLFVAAVVCAEASQPASLLLPEVVRARFDLSSAIVRSATRRYRR